MNNVNQIPNASFFSSSVTRSLLATPMLLQIVRRALPDASCYYILMYSGAQLLALICVTEVSQSIGPFRFRTAVCGNPIISADSAIFTTGHIARQDMLAGLLRSLTASMDDRKVDVVLLKEIVAPDNEMRSLGYTKVPLEPVLGLKLRAWTTFKDYLNSLKSHYRSNYQRAERKLIAQGVVISWERDVSYCVDELFELFRSVAAHVGPKEDPRTSSMSWLARQLAITCVTSRWKTLDSDTCNHIATALTNIPRGRFPFPTKEFFLELQSTFRHNTDIITLKQGSRLVGATINLQDGPLLHSIYIGMIRDELTPYLYRRLVAAKVEAAISRGVEHVHFGRTALQTKADFGAIALPEACYCRVRPRLLRTIIHSMADKVCEGQSSFVARDVWRAANSDEC